MGKVNFRFMTRQHYVGSRPYINRLTDESVLKNKKFAITYIFCKFTTPEEKTTKVLYFFIC